MAQDFDKIFREVLKDIFPALARKVLGIPAGDYKPLPVDLQYTCEREADQLWEIVPQQAEPFIPNQTLPGSPLERTAPEKADLVAFMHALTNTPFAASAPRRQPRFPEKLGLHNRPLGGTY
jgi:hypothetical protein